MAHEMYKRFNEERRRRFAEENGIDVPPLETLLHTRSALERKQSSEIVDLAPGLQLEMGSLSLGTDGSYVNFYDLARTSSERVTVELFSTDTPLLLKRIIQNDPSVVAVTNGGFFLLADQMAVEQHGNHNLQLEIRNGMISSLPVADRPFLYSVEGGVAVAEVTAAGEVVIGGSRYTWRGSQSEATNGEAVLYTSASGVVKHEKSDKAGSMRVMKPVTTPVKNGVIDMVIAQNSEGDLYVKATRPGGGSSVYQELGVLQVLAPSTVTPGDAITLSSIQGIDISGVTSGFCIGPNVAHFLHTSDHPINHDSSLGDNVPFGTNRIARNVIYMDGRGTLHTRLFDGLPRSALCAGISPHEVATHMAELGVSWAYFLDGGQSAKIVTREISADDGSRKIKSYGNYHYVRWPTLPQHPHLWVPDGGRKVPSGLVFKARRP